MGGHAVRSRSANGAPRTFVLVHSPLVGPATWRAVAEALTRAGERAVVPSRRGAAAAPVPRWRWCVARVVDAVPEHGNVVLVAHSAAGLWLPAVEDALRGRGVASVFADAQVPSEVVGDDDWFLAHVHGLADEDGVLPPWTDWWGEGAMEALVPDPTRRREIAREAQPTPVEWFTEPGPPGDDPVGPAAYLQFSAVFAATAEHARSRGWWCEHLAGEHLHMAVDPEAVAGRLVAIADRLLAAR